MKISKEEEDVYGRLGEPLWSSILSLVPLHEAVRTSVLSRSWRHAWTRIPDLDLSIFQTTLWRFDDEEKDEWFPHQNDVNDWVKTVDHILNSHTRPIMSCCIPVYYYYDSSHVDRWIDILMQRSIQRLEIESDEDFTYKVPESLFDCKTLKTLALQCCDMRLSAELRLGCENLRSLELYDTAVDARTIQRFLLQSKLESLTLYDCDVFEWSLHINAPNLKCLDISFNGGAAESARIDAPHLKSLDLKYWFVVHKVEVCAPELQRVCCNATGGEGEKMRNLLSSISHAKVLQLSGSTKCLQGIADFPSALNVNKLTIQGDMSGRKGVEFLLSKCPYLEDLEIWNRQHYFCDEKPSSPDVFGCDYWKGQERLFDFLQFNLKKVVIKNQKKDGNDFCYFLEFLSRNAKNLKYMRVTSPPNSLLETISAKMPLKSRKFVSNKIGDDVESQYIFLW